MSTIWGWIPLGVRIAVFRLLDAASELRQGRKASIVKTLKTPPDAAATPSVWLFVSTIGELNAIEPFIKRLLSSLGQPALTLLTDRTTYDDAYRARYPQARIEIVSGAWAEAEALVLRRPPSLLLLAEIPCCLHDAPCRFSFALLHAARRAGAKTVMVNGWLYGYQPPSRLDAIEAKLFGSDYVCAFDLMLVQTEAVRAHLLAAGAAPDRVVTTGNVKFDAMTAVPAGDLSSPLNDALTSRGQGCPIIVAGSVTETVDQAALLNAFRAVLQKFPGALLVLAPRHPENKERMAALHALLRESGLNYRLRSAHDAAASLAGDVLVLDTMGELRGCYAAATLSFVGVDHNVLEPLAFGKPVFVFDGWEASYPSYPVFQQMRDAGAVEVVADKARLDEAFLRGLHPGERPGGGEHDHIRGVLDRARGAVERNLAAFARAGLLQAAETPAQPS